ncbi:phosphate signaling complex protein PhoU [Oscillochloris sp. ZM17-4]|uniref:phosphate signaling complex protein PhoU n=1 Tax=Oscillochloris sp. ZM17-4 TaxID=2866714 RepID=UPI001C7312F8|nr:phosphate signaling complex protein PhoU [Oscillochloris sp. ZM17-4]MBX0330973.1 phosphate signaling complex protein PhoU [Oscillochloris sp. ZM17-4]
MQTREHFDTELGELQAQIRSLGGLVRESVALAIVALRDQDDDLAEQVSSSDHRINAAQQEIESHAINLVATQQPVARDLRRILASIMIGAELERIGDYAKGIARLVIGRLGEPPLTAGADLIELGVAAQTMLDRALEALAGLDPIAARALGPADDEVDALYTRTKLRLATQLSGNPSGAPRAADLLFVAHNFERIADRSTNVAERTIYIASGELVELNP